MDDSTDATVRPYDHDADWPALWSLKRAFERELGSADDEKAARYEGKLTDDYRAGYREWVADCVRRDPGCVLVADDDGPVGYCFLLPADLAYIWDAAVVNELYLAPEYRGSGLADDLFEAALAHAAEQSLPLDRVVLDVDPENERAARFYERFDFEPWAELVARSVGGTKRSRR
ncbi:GNAT family N-acetyltransferase [Halomarina ordinaria]|uniref:GNAT family N-acetyltransferase n=1 Tax=Halomarina ordinaria TaxID=3033939 RepID=A0ABD5UDJ3_9EURY|nr:GNAT family N-acetyltransferase [Halomarina sp. PSRA2]